MNLKNIDTYTLNDFEFDLPQALIAQQPTPKRSSSRLLDGTQEPLTHRIFSDLPQLLCAGDLLIFNDTQVIKARLYGHKSSGGAIEVLVERLLPNNQVLAHVRASKSPQPGSALQLSNHEGQPAFEAQVLARQGVDGALFQLQFPSDPATLLESHGHVPLPPYITHVDDTNDQARYQTVFSKVPGAVAAPTAALHFDEELLKALKACGIAQAFVTLHVGAGTFQPVRSQQLSQHQMHSEWFNVPLATVQAIRATRQAGGRVVAVGTTTLRALESAALLADDSEILKPGAHETDIFITPGFDFKVIDLLITNFHLPKSTLLMLVSAFVGHTQMKALYETAIQERYRFFSYGDAMLLKRSINAHATPHAL
jgi:S-adenosylmethionine:tRNA ribosyltransferase-isomerase